MQDEDEEWQPEWVKVRLGKNVIERVTRTGRETMDYMESLEMEMGADRKRVFQSYMAKTGQGMLEMRIYDTGEEDRQRDQLVKQMVRAGRILRKHIKVSENEAGQKSVAIDKEWNTGSWTPEMIEAGIDVLFYIFLDDGDDSINIPKRPQAVIMLEKLLQRHVEARSYIQFKLDDLMTQALNSYIKFGKARAKLEILYILHAAREKFINQISEFSIAARAAELMSSEMRLAAIIIQQVFRVFMNTKTKKMDYSVINPIAAQFGTDEEMLGLRERAATLRTMDLKRQWNLMHQFSSREARNTIGGFRGPCHIPPHFVTIILDIVHTTVSKLALKYAPMNRENFIEGNGAILLSNLVSCPTSKFGYISLQILAHVAKVPNAWRPCLESGCVKAIFRFLSYLKQTGKLYWMAKGTDGLDKLRDKSDEEKMAFQVHKFAFFDGILALTKLAVHSAGVFRARAGYGYRRPAQPDAENANYLNLLNEFNGAVSPSLNQSILGDVILLKMLVKMTIDCRHLQATRSLLLCLFTLSCSECHKPILFEIVANSGAAMLRLLELLEERDSAVSSLAVCFYLQMCTLELARDSLITTEIAPALHKLTKATLNLNFKKRPYQRAILITCGILRQHDWRAYDPETFPAFMSNEESVRKSAYLDLLKTIKSPGLAIADTLTIADLVVMPTFPRASMDLSLVAEDMNVGDIADFFVHPGETKFIECLPWEEAAASCVILEAITRNCSTAEHLVALSNFEFLGRYIFISRYLVEQGKLTNSQLLVLVNGINSAASALSRLVWVATGYEVRERIVVSAVFETLGFIDSVSFWVLTLADQNKGMDSLVLSVLRESGLNFLILIHKIANLILHIAWIAEEDEKVRMLLSLELWAKSCASVICKNHIVYAGQKTLKYNVLEKACRFCATMMEHEKCTTEGIVKWGIVEGLRIHLPTPNFGIGATPDEAYSDAITQMPLSVVRLLGEICQSNRGKENCLADGFLRRVLDKLNALHPMLETNERLKIWAEHIKQTKKSRFDEDKELSASLTRLVVSECLRVIERCANFSSPTVGSSNDLILDTVYYAVIDICKGIIEKEACPKTDGAYLAALRVLAKLALDSFRLEEKFAQIDILGLVRIQLSYVGELPEDGVKSCLDIIQALAAGFPSEYKSQQFFQFRESLGKVTNQYSGLGTRVRIVNWEMFLSSEKADKRASDFAENEAGNQEERTAAVSVKKTQTPPIASEWNGETFSFENDRILKEMLQTMYVKAGLPEESNLLASRQSSRQSSRRSSRHSSRAQSARENSNSRRPSFENPATALSSYRAIPGTYDSSREMSLETMRSLMISVPQLQNDTTNLAKLSAREPSLRNEILDRKAKSGFVAKMVSPIKDRRVANAIASKKAVSPGSPIKSQSIGKRLTPLHSTTTITKNLAVVAVDSAPELMRTRPPVDDSGPFIC